MVLQEKNHPVPGFPEKLAELVMEFSPTLQQAPAPRELVAWLGARLGELQRDLILDEFQKALVEWYHRLRRGERLWPKGKPYARRLHTRWQASAGNTNTDVSLFLMLVHLLLTQKEGQGAAAVTAEVQENLVSERAIPSLKLSDLERLTDWYQQLTASPSPKQFWETLEKDLAELEFVEDEDKRWNQFALLSTLALAVAEVKNWSLPLPHQLVSSFRRLFGPFQFRAGDLIDGQKK